MPSNYSFQSFVVFSAIFLSCFSLVFCDLPSIPPSDPRKSIKLPPCKACTVLVDSFKEGMKRTERNKHDGGDAAWEEEKLGSYKTSEIRLVEIQEKLCSGIDRGQDQCHQLAEDNEHEIESWWFKKQSVEPDLYKYLCIDELKVCCPDGFFGPDCKPCPTCGGNGKCKGNGTRKGNGKCACDSGYQGNNCQECAVQYYESFKDEEKLLCSPCFKACGDAGCTGPGAQNCLNCLLGWRLQNNDDPKASGCQDIDECLEEKNRCTKNQFCVNNEGSFSCLECDKSCDGCSGDGPDLCDKCADGFEIKDGMCSDVSSEKKNQYVTMTRYMTYLGLCIATCVIFQSSLRLASLVGLAVAIYITVSEYWLSTNTNSSTPKPLPDHLVEQLRDKLAI